MSIVSSSSSSSLHPIVIVPPKATISNNESKTPSSDLGSVERAFCLIVAPPIVACGKRKDVSEEERRAYRANPPSNALRKLPSDLLHSIIKMAGGVDMVLGRQILSDRFTDDMTDWFNTLPADKDHRKWNIKEPEIKQIVTGLMNPSCSIDYCPPWPVVFKGLKIHQDRPQITGIVRWIYFGNPIIPSQESLSQSVCDMLALDIRKLADPMLLKNNSLPDSATPFQIVDKAELQESFAIKECDASPLTEGEFANDDISRFYLRTIIEKAYKINPEDQEYTNRVLLKLCFVLAKLDEQQWNRAMDLQRDRAEVEFKRKAAGVCHAAICKGWSSKLLSLHILKLLHNHGYINPDALTDQMKKFVLDCVNADIPIFEMKGVVPVDQLKALLLAHKEKIINLNLSYSERSLDEILENFPNLTRLSTDRPLPAALLTKIKVLGTSWLPSQEIEMPNLESLHVYNVHQTEFNLIAPKLKELTLDGSSVTEVPTLHQCQHLRKLVVLFQAFPYIIRLPSVRTLYYQDHYSLAMREQHFQYMFPNATIHKIDRDNRDYSNYSEI